MSTTSIASIIVLGFATLAVAGNHSVLPRSFNGRTGITEALVENPPGLDKRREAIIDALWKRDAETFASLAESPSTGKGGLANETFDGILEEFEIAHDGDKGLRTMRALPVDPAKDKPDTSLWCRHQWMTLTDDPELLHRGNLNLIFDSGDLSLRFVRIVNFNTENGINVLPEPDPEIENDSVIDRSPVTMAEPSTDSAPPITEEKEKESATPDPISPPDYTQYHEEIEYKSGHRNRGMLGRRSLSRNGITEAHVANPPGLDNRREAIIDALWTDDEDQFLELAISPITGEGGLANQSFRELSRAFKRYRDEDFRTMRQHPVTPDKSKEKTNTWCRHQWMTLPKSTKRTPERGNLNLIFDSDDLSLRFVRFNPFSKTNDVNILPRPNEAIPNDPVRDRAAVVER